MTSYEAASADAKSIHEMIGQHTIHARCIRSSFSPQMRFRETPDRHLGRSIWARPPSRALTDVKRRQAGSRHARRRFRYSVGFRSLSPPSASEISSRGLTAGTPESPRKLTRCVSAGCPVRTAVSSFSAAPIALGGSPGATRRASSTSPGRPPWTRKRESAASTGGLSLRTRPGDPGPFGRPPAHSGPAPGRAAPP
jgi:hypothetical protein